MKIFFKKKFNLSECLTLDVFCCCFFFHFENHFQFYYLLWIVFFIRLNFFSIIFFNYEFETIWLSKSKEYNIFLYLFFNFIAHYGTHGFLKVLVGNFFCGDILQFLKEIFDGNNQMKIREIDWLYNLISRVFFCLKSTLTVILLLRPHLRSFCLSTQSQDLYTTQLFNFFRIFFFKNETDVKN